MRRLEAGQLGLSESLECYEAGVKQLKQCYRALETTERKIALLTGVDADGRPITEAFDEAEMSLDEKAATRSRRRSRPGLDPTPAPPRGRGECRWPIGRPGKARRAVASLQTPSGTRTEPH